MTAQPDPPDLPLDRIYFGRDDAETDAGAAGLLRAGFLRTAAYEAAVSGRKQLLIGRKGAGKTAIRLMLAEAEKPRSSVITPDEISADEFRRFELHGVTRQTAKQFLWRYVMALQLAKIVVRHAQAAHKKPPASIARLRDFLAANDETGADPQWHDRFWKTIQRLRSSLSLQAFGVTASLELSGTGDAPQGVRIAAQLDVVENRLAQALDELHCPPGHEPLLVVDKLDDVWSNDENSDDLVVGLLTAAKHMTAAFPGVRCVVCIRSDIYDALQFPDRDKFHSDEMRIDWSPHTLIDLLVNRAAASTGAQLSPERLFGGCFPEQIRGLPAATYLVDRTLLRPRDLIQFANHCRDTAAKNGNRTITEADVLEAEPQYSAWKLQDLASEYSVSFPFLNDMFVLFQSAPYRFTRAELVGRIETFAAQLELRYSRFADLFTPVGISAVLYGIGFLGVGGDGGFRYVHEGGPQLNGSEAEFCVHPAFRQALRAVSNTGVAVYEQSAAGGLRASRAGGWPRYRGGPGDLLYDAAFEAQDRASSLIVDTPLDAALKAELLASLLAIRHDTRTRRGADNSVEAGLEHALSVSAFLSKLALDLTRLDTGDERLEVLAGRIGRIATNLAEQAAGESHAAPRPSEIS